MTPVFGTSFAARQSVKRSIDILVATALLLPAAPIIAVVAVAVQARSTGPMMFRQTREGRFGRPFAMWKLRTMYVNAAELLEQTLAASPSARDEWMRYRRLDNDPRIVGGIGHLVRRWSIDELPQLWNVLRGDMSIVGPRPLELDVVNAFAPASLALRRRVRPGMTGLWQVSGRSEHDLMTLIELDTEYVQQWSLRSDLAILVRTPAAVLSRRGAY